MAQVRLLGGPKDGEVIQTEDGLIGIPITIPMMNTFDPAKCDPKEFIKFTNIKYYPQLEPWGDVREIDGVYLYDVEKDWQESERKPRSPKLEHKCPWREWCKECGKARRNHYRNGFCDTKGKEVFIHSNKYEEGGCLCGSSGKCTYQPNTPKPEWSEYTPSPLTLKQINDMMEKYYAPRCQCPACKSARGEGGDTRVPELRPTSDMFPPNTRGITPEEKSNFRRELDREYFSYDPWGGPRFK